MRVATVTVTVTVTVAAQRNGSWTGDAPGMPRVRVRLVAWTDARGLGLPDSAAVRRTLVALLNADESVARWTLLIPFPYGEAEAEAFLGLCEAVEGEGSKADAMWAVVDADTGAVVGGAGMHRSKAPGRAHVFSIGYWIATAARRKGYALAAVQEIIKLAPRGARVEADVFAENEASAGVLTRAGFTCVAANVPNYYEKDGKRRAASLFALDVPLTYE